MNLFRLGGWTCLLLAGCGAAPQDTVQAPRAEVHGVPARMGDLPIHVAVYGVAQPQGGAAQAISTQASGAVAQLAVTPGQAVRRGQLMLTLRLAPAAWAAWRQAERAVRTAKLSRDRVASLLVQQLATREQLSQADKAWADAQDARDALRQQQGDAPTLAIRAPDDGVVQDITVTPGQSVAPGTNLLSWLPAGQLLLRAGAEADSGIKAGDEATVSLLEGGGKQTGSVRQVGDALDLRTHQRDIAIVVPQPLLAGAGYRADVVVRHQHGWLVPRQALVGDDGGWHVFQLDGDKAVAVPVSVLAEDGDTSVVDGHLDGGRVLVDIGATQLEEGMATHVAGGAGR